MVVSRNLCSCCIEVTRTCLKSPSGSWVISETQTFATFREATGEGCFICSTIWNRSDQHRICWSNLDPETWLPMEYTSYRPDKRGSGSIIQLMVKYKELNSSGEVGPRFMFMRFNMIPYEDEEYRKMFSFDELASSTASSSALDLAFQWYQDCRQSHAECKAAPSWTPGWLPTRLLEIGEEGDPIWKLRLTSEDISYTPTPPYMTLSYRWGVNHSHLLLLSSNFNSFRQGRPMSELPTMFQEFSVVARRFSIRYIWIDSLCIIQDSVEDWESEAPMMGRVYGNSACNVAASASAGPSDGLFRRRNTEEIRPDLIEASLTSPIPSRYYIYDMSYWNRQLFDGTLHTRGWVFQERFLVPRTLFFCKKQIMWECCAEHKCEAFRRGIPFHQNQKDLRTLSDLRASSQSLAPAKLTAKSAELWARLVATYSQCVFTQPGDRLWAFSGIAYVFQTASGDDYLAGLWRSQLLEMMDWFVVKPTSVQPKAYRCPSWSWMAIDSSVTMARNSMNSRFLAEVVDVKFESTEAESMRGIVGGSLRLRAPIVATRCKLLDPDSRELHVEICDEYRISKIYPDVIDIKFSHDGHITLLLHKVTDTFPAEAVCFILEAEDENSCVFRRRGYLVIRGEDHVRSAQISAELRMITFI